VDLGHALGEHHDAALAYGALAMAVAVRGGAVPGVVFHTDQGSEYTARSFRQACERLGIAQLICCFCGLQARSAHASPGLPWADGDGTTRLPLPSHPTTVPARLKPPGSCIETLS
jgi:hypothetical protein